MPRERMRARRSVDDLMWSISASEILGMVHLGFEPRAAIEYHAQHEASGLFGSGFLIERSVAFCLSTGAAGLFFAGCVKSKYGFLPVLIYIHILYN